jgi:hypothetical protein
MRLVHPKNVSKFLIISKSSVFYHWEKVAGLDFETRHCFRFWSRNDHPLTLIYLLLYCHHMIKHMSSLCLDDWYACSLIEYVAMNAAGRLNIIQRC